MDGMPTQLNTFLGNGKIASKKVATDWERDFFITLDRDENWVRVTVRGRIRVIIRVNQRYQRCLISQG